MTNDRKKANPTSIFLDAELLEKIDSSVDWFKQNAGTRIGRSKLVTQATKWYLNELAKEDAVPAIVKKFQTMSETQTPVEVQFSFAEDSLKIKFSDNPGRQTIAALRSAGAKWNPIEKTWMLDNKKIDSSDRLCDPETNDSPQTSNTRA